jgi:Domain of unknown function (DUF4340)
VRPKTLAALAVVVAGMAAFIAFYDRDQPSTDERKANEKKAFRLEADDVTALEIEKGAVKVRLERDAKPKSGDEEAPAIAPQREWRIVAPITARADRSLADGLASDLAGLQIERRLDGAAKQELGLDPPRGIVRWSGAKGQGELEIGSDIPASSNVVVEASGQKDPLVVGKSIVQAIDRAPGDWRAKEMLPATRDEIERVRMVAPSGEEVVLSKKGESFALERPIADAADRDLVDPLLSDLTGLKAEKFLDSPLAAEAEKGLSESAGRIELGLKDKSEPFVIELGAEVTPGGHRYARVAGQAIEAETKLAESLGRAPADWRSKSWTSFDSWKVERIRIEDANGKFELTRSSGDWLRDGKKIPYTEVGDLLYAITSARGQKLLVGDEAKTSSAAQPSTTVVFSDANGAEETLTLYPPTADGVPARVSGRDVVLLLDPKTADDVVAKIASVRAAKPIEEEKKADEKKAVEKKADDDGKTPPAADSGATKAPATDSGAESKPPAPLAV